ncbi:unnamed protein product [Ilex paraguariensis]|uniref:FAS1 domain-containing protein n=1 Tax=Ilex paraguariensis TaxID=185542 RepID=A0ABC8QU62_9AQUA
MATSLLLIILTCIFVCTSATTATASTSSIAPSSNPHQDHAYPPSLFAIILSTLGFQELSSAATTASLSIPTTIFAPTDSSLLTCPSCSLPLLLQEHSVPGLYPLHFLLTLPFGTKLETLSPNRCLTITTGTTSASLQKVFINGAEITRPNLFNKGLIIVHGLQGFVSHLSPLSCNVERMTSLSFPSHPPPTASFFIMRLMLKDAMLRLRTNGYSLLALAIRVKYYAELSDLKALTVFALDDESIFAGGHTSYVSDLRFHIVPNRLLMADELMRLPAETVLPTMESGKQLVVTNAGGGGGLLINHVRIKSPDVLYNNRIVVHGLFTPFPHTPQRADGDYWQIAQSTSNGGVDQAWAPIVAPVAGARSMLEIEDHHGL